MIYVGHSEFREFTDADNLVASTDWRAKRWCYTFQRRRSGL